MEHDLAEESPVDLREWVLSGLSLGPEGYLKE